MNIYTIYTNTIYDQLIDWVFVCQLTDDDVVASVSSFGFFRGPMACRAVRLASLCRSSSISARCISFA